MLYIPIPMLQVPIVDKANSQFTAHNESHCCVAVLYITLTERAPFQPAFINVYTDFN